MSTYRNTCLVEALAEVEMGTYGLCTFQGGDNPVLMWISHARSSKPEDKADNFPVFIDQQPSALPSMNYSRTQGVQARELISTSVKLPGRQESLQAGQPFHASPQGSEVVASVFPAPCLLVQNQRISFLEAL